MNDVIIKVEGLGKKYIISHENQGHYTALRDIIANKAKSILKKKEQLPSREEFWALKDVNFEIKKGEAVGIIGRNGAGKSTLLKVLSRITEPTTGRIELNGRVASLLEVGTGFHPELTGRENIFLNGAILGMSRTEIKSKFDEIVDFSGVEKFLDTPVKRYSSGMYVRLAFAVAAHLEPEILVVDEVLAVGDAEFQKKCLGKMKNVSINDGRTVLFVSHHMGTIAQLCKKVLLLEKGVVLKYADNAMEGIDQYLKLNRNNPSYVNDGTEHEVIGVKRISVTNTEGEALSDFTNKDEIVVDFELEYYQIPQNTSLYVSILNQYKMPVFSEEQIIEANRMRLKIFPDFLVQGNYSISVILHLIPSETYFTAEDICPFHITDIDSKMIVYNNFNHNYGNVFGKAKWIS